MCCVGGPVLDHLHTKFGARAVACPRTSTWTGLHYSSSNSRFIGTTTRCRRLAGLSDAEYFWEPVPGAWNIRRRGEAGGRGTFVPDFAYPEPVPPPVTTIAWRIGHVIVGVFGARNASHFGGPPMDYVNVDWPGDAESALAMLDDVLRRLGPGVARLDEQGLASAGRRGRGSVRAHPYASLVLHIHREAIHHMAEVALLRDLYRAQS